MNRVTHKGWDQKRLYANFKGPSLWKKGIVRFTTVQLKTLKTVFYGFSAKVTHYLLIRNNGEIVWAWHFSSQKNDVLSKVLIRSRFQGCRCKSGVAILELRVTWIYAYSPFKRGLYKNLFSLYFYLAPTLHFYL